MNYHFYSIEDENKSAVITKEELELLIGFTKDNLGKPSNHAEVSKLLTKLLSVADKSNLS